MKGNVSQVCNLSQLRYISNGIIYIKIGGKQSSMPLVFRELKKTKTNSTPFIFIFLSDIIIIISAIGSKYFFLALYDEFINVIRRVGNKPH